MKKLLVLVLALIMVFSSTAFAAVELEMNFWMAEQEDGIMAAVDAFNASQDEIKVNASVVPWGQYWDKLVVGLPAGSAPDVFSINALNVVDYARNGYLIDLTDLFESGAIDVSKYPAHAVDTHTVDGVLRGVPRDYDAIAVYYNKDMFDAAGVAYPQDGWTWDEFIETAKALTDAENGVYGCCIQAGGQAFGYDYIYGNGGQLFDENGMCVVNSPENVEAFTKLYEAITVHGISPTVEEQVEIDSDTRFQSYMTAMTFGGSWNMGLYVDAFGESLGVVQLPVMKEKSTISHSLSWVGAASTAHPEEVKTFLTYMAGAEAQAFASVQVIPAYEGTDAQWAARFENYNTNAFLGAIAEGWAHALPAAEKNVQEIFTKFDSYMVEMLSTGEIETNLAAMEAEFNELLK
jgi:multiple sugar transport system substrate-binding protein